MPAFTVKRVVQQEGFKDVTITFEPTPMPKVQRHDQARQTAGKRAYRKSIEARGFKDVATFEPAKNPDVHDEALEEQFEAVAREEVTFLFSRLKSWDYADGGEAWPLDPEYLALLPLNLFRAIYAVALGYAAGKQIDADKKKPESPPS